MMVEELEESHPIEIHLVSFLKFSFHVLPSFFHAVPPCCLVSSRLSPENQRAAWWQQRAEG